MISYYVIIITTTILMKTLSNSNSSNNMEKNNEFYELAFKHFDFKLWWLIQIPYTHSHP